MEHYFSRLQRAVRNYWDKQALNNFEGEGYTYAHMATAIEKVHIIFETGGIKKGDKVAICAKNSARWGITFLAINTYETVVVPILADFPPESVNNLVNHSDSIVLFTDSEIWKKLDITKMPNIRVVVNVGDFSLMYCTDPLVTSAYEHLNEQFAKRYPMGFLPENVNYPTDNLKDLAVINYTSGTSSAPKGVMLTYECFSATIEYGQKNVPSSDQCTMISMLPMAHMYGLVYEFLYPLSNGTPITFLGKAPTPTTLLKAFHEVKPYLLITVPLVMEKIFKAKIKPMLNKPAVKVLTAIPGLRKIVYHKVTEGIEEAFGGNIQMFIMGGAALNPEMDKWFYRIHLPYTVGYGMTEATPLLGYINWKDYIPGSCGHPVDCADVRIDSEDPQHIVGEIQAKGQNICIGYYKNPEASANAFTEDGYLRTGDLGIIDENNNIFIKGRSKSMILTANGQNVYPEELEALVNNQDYVSESIVVDRGSQIVALVYLDQDAIKSAGLDEEAVSEIPENIKLNVNKLLPSYSFIVKVEVQDKPFEKTPKMSIKRYLYK